MSTPSIFVATPCYGGQAFTTYVSSLLALQRACIERNVPVHVELGGGDALIPRARGIMAAKFLERSDYSHLLFIDADMGFTPDQVFRLLDSGLDVVGGVYPAKKIDWAAARRAWEKGTEDVAAASHPYVVRFLPSETNAVEVDNAGFGPVAYVGTGFLMIRRAALRRLTDAHPELRARHGDVTDAAMDEAVMLFETMIESDTGQYLSEDYAFCRRWRDLGGTIHADFTGRFTHVGHMAHRGGLMDVAAR